MIQNTNLNYYFSSTDILYKAGTIFFGYPEKILKVRPNVDSKLDLLVEKLASTPKLGKFLGFYEKLCLNDLFFCS